MNPTGKHICQVAFAALDAARLRKWHNNVFGLIKVAGIEGNSKKRSSVSEPKSDKAIHPGQGWFGSLLPVLQRPPSSQQSLPANSASVLH
ncbi:MAG: hypothetical protein P8Y92_10660 [Halioglobus sp.]